MAYDQTIYNTAIADGIPPILATLIVAQARHETGNYTSNIFKEGLNAFGYSFVEPNGSMWQLPTPGRVADNNRAAGMYAIIQDSVHEITAPDGDGWISRRQREGKFPQDLTTITTPEQYATLLKNAGYYGASIQTYINGLKSALSKIGAVAGSSLPFVLVALVILLVVDFQKGSKRKGK